MRSSRSALLASCKAAQFSRSIGRNALPLIALVILLAGSGELRSQSQANGQVAASARPPISQSLGPEYLWYETENMRGFGTKPNGEPIQNPSWMNLAKADAPGWGMNGPGVSAEWSQGGESEWNSAAASADETSASIYQDFELPRAGKYRFWVRYADWGGKTESFVLRLTQGGREVAAHEFGSRDLIDEHDEVSLYWGWSFVWDGAEAQLEKGPARITLAIEKKAGARRHVDCVLLTNDLAYVPAGRRKPDFAAMRYLREFLASGATISSLLSPLTSTAAPVSWQPPKIARRDFLMPWNIAPEFWKLSDQPAAERPLYPFNAEPIDEFVKKYKGAAAVPLFSSRFVVPVIYINNFPEYFKESSPFLRYLRETKTPFAILINYGEASFTPADGQATWKLLTGEFKDQFLGWMSGESVGYVWDKAPAELKVTATMTRRELLEAHRIFYTDAIARKWAAIFHTDTGAMWDKLIPAQSTSSTSFAHALTRWGVRLLGVETAAVQPMFAMRIAFTRGAARQFGGAFLYYHAPNFGDTATTFTKQQNFAGPDNFYHSRYGATMGPSLSWYRKSYYLYYMAGASAIYLEQGFDQFFKPGPGDHEFQLNPLGRVTDEFMRFAEKHPDRGAAYTPIAFLLDPAHGWEMTDYPQWPFEVSPIDRGDRALRELFGTAYFPGLVVEGEPATSERQSFVNGIFGDIFDVLVATDGETPGGSPGVRESPRVSQPSLPPAKSVAPKKPDLAYEGSNVPSPVADAATPAGAAATPASDPRASAASRSPLPPVPFYPLASYRAVVLGGHISLSSQWAARLTEYVKSGGTLVLNAAQIKGLAQELLGIQLTGATAETDSARCLAPGEPPQNLGGQMFRYEKLELRGAQPLIVAEGGDSLVTVNHLGKGAVIFSAVADLLGEDERITPFAAHMLAHVFANATPLTVTGKVEYLINRTPRGWVVTCFNNEGVLKPQQGLPQVDHDAYSTALISLRGELVSAREWLSDRNLEIRKQTGGTENVSVSIPPGGIAIVELELRP
jgi:hypothetical protein